MMEGLLKQVLGRTDAYLDFHSVIGGFRDVGLIGLIEHPEYFNDKAGTHIPSFGNQLAFLKDYLRQAYPDYSLIQGWSHLYFVAQNGKKVDIVKLLDKHPVPIESQEGEKMLGLLLSYPECCVNANIVGKRSLSVLPFAPCSTSCDALWEKEYRLLAQKYGVNLRKKYLR